MDLRIKGRQALVLGASKGLGQGIARALAAEGCNVMLGARNLEALTAEAADLAKAHGVTAEAFAVDMAKVETVDAIVEAAKDRGVDILVNNTGGPPPSVALGIPYERWFEQFTPMVANVIRMTDALVPSMRERGWGRVLTIASSGVVQPIPNIAMSNTLRAGLVAFMKTLAGEVAGDGVTVNVILPGRIDTERLRSIDNTMADRQGVSVAEVAEKSQATIAAGRYGEVDEFASVAAFLCSGPASYVTGQSVLVDGGMVRRV